METRTRQFARFAAFAATALALHALAAPAVAATTSASMTVSFRIVDSCQVNGLQSGAGGAPRVNCAYNTLYQIGNGMLQPATPVPAATDAEGGRVVTITF